jgi:hypothetical protein
MGKPHKITFKDDVLKTNIEEVIEVESYKEFNLIEKEKVPVEQIANRHCACAIV